MTDDDRPPWVWEDLPGPIRAESWRRLAAWVDWLATAYDPWVQLPPCWPAHEGLRTELAMFWVWHRWLTTAARNPADGVRWHTELRAAAEAWRVLATCRHDTPVAQRSELDARRLARRDLFLAQMTGTEDR